MIPVHGMPVNEIFQGLEDLSRIFPMLGRFCPSDTFTFSRELPIA